MTTLHETAYPSLKPDPTPRELAELYKVSGSTVARRHKKAKESNLLS